MFDEVKVNVRHTFIMTRLTENPTANNRTMTSNMNKLLYFHARRRVDITSVSQFLQLSVLDKNHRGLRGLQGGRDLRFLLKVAHTRNMTVLNQQSIASIASGDSRYQM